MGALLYFVRAELKTVVEMEDVEMEDIDVADTREGVDDMSI